MPNGRPYDAELVNKVITHIERGTIPTTPDSPGPSAIHDPGFEHYHGNIHNWAVAVGGLFRIFTAEGRVRRQERLQHRLDVAEFIGDRVLHPRGGGTDATQKIGWVGTHKFDSLPVTRREEDYTNIGFMLLDSKNIDTSPPTINKLRPVTRSEKAADRRIEKHHHKAAEHAAEARWLDKSHGRRLYDRNSGHRLSSSERKAMQQTSRSIKSHERKSEKHHQKLEKISGSRDFRGKFVRFRSRIGR